MYVIELDAAERDYLLSLLRGRRASHATQLTDRLRAADDVFGTAMWCNDDLASILSDHSIPTSPENVQALRDSYFARHLGDHMVSCGWEMLEEAAQQLKSKVATLG